MSELLSERITAIENAISAGILPDDDRVREALANLWDKGFLAGKIQIEIPKGANMETRTAVIRIDKFRNAGQFMEISANFKVKEYLGLRNTEDEYLLPVLIEIDPAWYSNREPVRKMQFVWLLANEIVPSTYRFVGYIYADLGIGSATQFLFEVN